MTVTMFGLQNLNRFALWAEVLPELGMSVPTAALPCRTRCPFCGADHQFTVYHDPVYSGQWTHCRGCGWAGDIIELAAGVWKTDVEMAINRLAAAGKFHLDLMNARNHLPGYQSQFVRYRRKVLAFWEKCRTSRLVAESGELRVLLSNLMIEPDVTLDQWQRHAGMFVGACHRRDAEIDLRVADDPPQARNPDGGKNRAFVGNGWAEILVVPAWDMPGRIRAFAFIGRQGRPDDIIIRPVIGNTGCRLRELGLALLPAAFDARTAVVTDDLVAALRKQHQHLRDGGKPLPIVVRLKSKDRSTQAYSALGQAAPVFWGMRVTHETVELARRHGGRVCTEDAVSDTVTRHLSRYEAQTWYDRAVKRSKDWYAALEERQRAVGETEGQAEVAAMSLNADEREMIRSREELRTTQDRLARTEQATGVSVQLGSNVFTECREGIRRNGEIVVNARLRIDELVTVGREIYYRGSVGFRDHEVPFVEPQQRVETNTLVWMREVVLAAGKGVVTYGKGYGTQITQVAMQLHPPRHVQGADRVGWQADPPGFVFAGFMATRDGFELDGGYPLKNESTPTIGCDPDPLTDAEWRELTAAGDMPELLWAVAAAVAADVVAPAYGLPTASIGAVGPSSGIALRMAEWLGCATYHPPGYKTGAARKAFDLTVEEALHGWPVVMPVAPKAGMAFRTWVGSAGARNSSWQVNWYESRIATMTGDHTRVEADGTGDPAPLRRPAAKLLPSFLRFLMADGLVIGGDGPLAERILRLMGRWIEAHAYDPGVTARALGRLDAAAQYADRPAQVARAFGELLGKLAAEGRLAFGRTLAKYSRRRQPPVVRDGDRTWLSKTALYRILAEKGLPSPDDQALGNALTEAGVLIAQEERMDPPLTGWVFSTRWWDDHLDTIRGTNRDILRLVS